MSTQPLQAATAVCRDVMANVTADQLTQQTPCESWDVAGLINHIIGGTKMWNAGLAGQQPEGLDTNWAEGDWQQAYDDSSAPMLEAFAADGVMEQSFTLPFGEFQGAMLMGMATTDLFQHAWDLAKATGQSTDLAPELAEGILAQQGVPDQFRGPEGAPFGQQQECADGACAADRLAAYLGREV